MHLAPNRFVALSCGQPGYVAQTVHPAAIGALNSASMAVPTGQPSGWDALLRSAGGAPADFVITLDRAVADALPRWPGQPELATWSLPDIVDETSGEELAVAAIRTLYSLRRRLELLASLPLAGADRGALRSDVRDLAHLQ